MAWFSLALFSLFIGSASSQLTTWDNQLFNFGWTPYDPTIVRCSTIPIAWDDRPTANPASTAPYTISVLQGGYQPITIGTSLTHAYNWTVALPTGGPYILTMKDAAGYTGGTSLVFNVADSGGATCTSNSTASANSLQVTSTGTYAECSTLVVTAQGGAAPYKMQIFAGERPPKTTTWITSTMSYTIDMKPSEQFFVVVTDANGLIAVDGMHSVSTGDSSCFEVARTVTVGATPTTLSYDPSSTVSIPTSSSSSSSSSRVIQNTGTTTVVTVIVQADGSSNTVTLPPGQSTTVPDRTTLPLPQVNSSLPAIIGGAVGGAALLVIALIAFLCYRRRSKKIANNRGNNEYKQPFSPVGPHPMPFGEHHVDPYTPFTPHTPGRDTAPLMAHMNSMYSSSGGSAMTPAPSTPGMSYFGNNNHVTTPGHPETTPVWAIPNVVRQGSVDATNYTASSSVPGSSLTASPSLREGIPPGAMAPQLGGGRHEKATFTPSRPAIAAPPPYSQGG